MFCHDKHHFSAMKKLSVKKHVVKQILDMMMQEQKSVFKKTQFLLLDISVEE